MTDVSGPLGNWRVVLTGGLAVLTAAVVTLVVRTGDPATADTVVVDAVNAVVVLPDGRSAQAVEGDVVPVGAVVRTGACSPCGAAQLRTADRDVYLGADSALRVEDGVRQRLDKGLAMVDSRRGPGLGLTTRAGVLAIDEGALVRVELGSLLLRVGTFAGDARLAAVGRQVTTAVPALHQLRAPYVGLPGGATALALTGDAWEETLAGSLVAADRDLVRLAAGLVGEPGRTVLTVAPAALRSPGPVAPAVVGEAALAVAVAQAGRADGGAIGRLAEVRESRAEGGSWGVVAALVDARVSAVSGVLDSWLAEPDAAVPPVDAVGGPDLSGVLGGSPRPTPGPSSVRPTRPGGSPSATSTPTPSPTTPPTSPPPANDLITTITGLLTSPPPSPTPTPTRSSPSPVLDLGIIRLP